MKHTISFPNAGHLFDCMLLLGYGWCGCCQFGIVFNRKLYTTSSLKGRWLTGQYTKSTYTTVETLMDSGLVSRSSNIMADD